MRKALPIAATVMLAASVAGCGGSDDGGNDGKTTSSTAATASTTAKPATANPALTVRMSEFAFDPKNARAKAGTVTITAPNDGKVVHELVDPQDQRGPGASSDGR